MIGKSVFDELIIIELKCIKGGIPGLALFCRDGSIESGCF